MKEKKSINQSTNQSIKGDYSEWPNNTQMKRENFPTFNGLKKVIIKTY